MTLSPHMAYCEVEVMKEMTFAQKALARAAGKEYVDTGEIINANVDVAMMDDILGPRIEIAEGLKELEAEVWDKSKVVVISDHYTPPCEIKQAEAAKKAAIGRNDAQKEVALSNAELAVTQANADKQAGEYRWLTCSQTAS